MNRIFKIFMLFVISALVVGCASKEDKAKEVATGLLNAYTSHDYETASQMCSPELQEMFAKAQEEFQALPDDFREILERESATLEAQIEGAYVVGESDTVVVSYNLIKNGCDTAKCHLQVVKEKVISLNK